MEIKLPVIIPQMRLINGYINGLCTIVVLSRYLFKVLAKNIKIL